MANLLSLPFDVKLLIVRYLDLSDCHLLKCQLNADGQHVSLSDAQFLQIFHAHTRITCIRNFCIPRSSTAFADLSRYLDFYWSLTFVSDADPTIPGNDSISGTYVGHPQGQLQSFGAPTLQEGRRIEQIMEPLMTATVSKLQARMIAAVHLCMMA